MTTTTDAPWSLETFDPFNEKFIQDPYPFYARLRAEDPVHFVPSLNAWWVTRYADVASMLQDARMSSALVLAGVTNMPDLPGTSGGQEIVPPMGFQDPPDHTRLRRLVAPAFAPKLMEQLRDRIRETARELLRQVESRTHMDIVAEYAVPLPITVIGDMLGVPEADRKKFRDWATAVEKGLDTSQPVSARIEGLKVRAEIDEYFTWLIDQRKEQPQEDLITRLLAAKEQGNSLSMPELLAFLSLMIGAGFGTTTGLIGSAAMLLMQHPDQLALLRERPELLPTAIDECLRYEPPVHRIQRVAKEDTVIGGRMIRKGDLVQVILGSANRDPDVFPDPDTFDITRQDNPHVAFGRGPHHCLGGYLARVEGQVAIEALLTLPRLELEIDRPEWNLNTTVRTLKALPVRIR